MSSFTFKVGKNAARNEETLGAFLHRKDNGNLVLYVRNSIGDDFRLAELFIRDGKLHLFKHTGLDPRQVGIQTDPDGRIIIDKTPC